MTIWSKCIWHDWHYVGGTCAIRTQYEVPIGDTGFRERVYRLIWYDVCSLCGKTRERSSGPYTDYICVETSK